MDIIGYFKHQGKRFYPLTHTKAVYDNNGIRLEDRLNQMGTEVTVLQSGLMSPSDKAKLDGMAVGANNYTHPSSHDASMITQDNAHRFVTDDEKSAWNSKLSSTSTIDGGTF